MPFLTGRHKDPAWWRAGVTPGDVERSLAESRDELIESRRARSRRQRRALGVPPAELADLSAALVDVVPADLEAVWVLERLRDALILIERGPAWDQIVGGDRVLGKAVLGWIVALVRDLVLSEGLPPEIVDRAVDVLSDLVVEVEVRL